MQPRNVIAARTGESTNQVVYCDASSDGAEFFQTSLPACYDKTCCLTYTHSRTTSYHHFLKKLKQGNRIIKTVPDYAVDHGFLVLGEFQQALQKGLAHLCPLFS